MQRGNNELGTSGFHDKFYRKNQALSRAYDIDNRDKVKSKDGKTESKTSTVACHKCKQVKLCTGTYIMETGHFDGAVSVSKNFVFFCADCAPRKKQAEVALSTKQISALLRGAKKGRV